MQVGKKKQHERKQGEDFCMQRSAGGAHGSAGPGTVVKDPGTVLKAKHLFWTGVIAYYVLRTEQPFSYETCAA
jgi:hypothetical protein